LRHAEILIAELDAEAKYTRKHLERVPMDKLDFKAGEKSMTLGWLATFLSIIPSWGAFTLTTDHFDATQAPSDRKIARTNDELTSMFDANIATVREALAEPSDEQLQQPWTLLAGGRTVFQQPRYLVFETYFMNHMVHHRAQLGIYLRLNGVAVPAVYNGSADEQGGMFMGVESQQ